MAFEFQKAFHKATELRSLTFSQQWTMSDDSIYYRYVVMEDILRASKESYFGIC
jgi:hypothetical protein